MKKAAIYLRVSTKDQNYDRQETELKALASQWGYEVAYIFEEKKSAVQKMDTREQLIEMMNLTKDDVERIFVWDVTRLSRRAIDFISIINDFTNKGICLHFKDKTIITLDDDGKQNMFTSMYLYILGLFAEMDAENLKAKMLSGKEAALARGNAYTNIAPFGYFLKDKHLYIKEDEAKYVRMAFTLYKEGKDLQYITDIFNANRVPLKSKSENIVWVKGGISQMLINTVYYGKGKRESKINPKDKNSEKLVRFFDAPALIGKELFDECRKQASLNTSKQEKGKKHPTLLRGLLVCGNCGKYYVLGNNNKQVEYRDGDLRANVNQRIGCKNGAIKAAFADDLVWKAIKGVYEFKTFKEKCLEDKEKSKLQQEKNTKTIVNIRTDLNTIENSISRLNKAYLKELFTEAEFEKQKQEYNSEKKRLEKTIEDFEAQNLLLDDRINANFDPSLFDSRDLSIEERKQVCNNLIEVIQIFNYGTNRRLLHIKLKVGLAFNLLTCTNPQNKEYCLLDDGTVTFNNPLSAPEEVRSLLKDFTVTSNNNELFNEEVFGEYSFMEIWAIANLYNLVKPIIL